MPKKQTDTKKPKPVEMEVATTGKDIDYIFYGWIDTLVNPDPVIQNEAGGNGIKLYDQIARDAHAGSVLQTRYLAVIGKEWSVVPAGEKKAKRRRTGQTREDKIAEFVENTLAASNIDQMRGEILQAILYGYYGAEIMWKTDYKGDVVIDRFYGKHPRRLAFTIDREPRLLTLRNMIEGEPLPPRKFLIFSWGDSDTPYGKGLGQKLWFPVWFKKHGIKFWVIFLEKFGSPTTVGKHPPGASKDQKNKLLAAIRAIQTETGITISENMAIELLEAARTGKATYGEMCEYMDRQISKAVLGQNLTTDISEKGSYSAAQVHDEVRQDIIEADADLLDAYLNKTLIPWLVDYNFPGVTEYPQFITHAGRKPDLAARSEVDERLSTKVGLPMTKSYFYETYGVPEPEDGEDLIERPVPQTPLNLSSGSENMKPGQDNNTNQQPGKEKAPGTAFAEGAGKPKYSTDQQAIEGLVDTSTRQAVAVFSEMLKPVKKIIKEAESLQEARDKIFAEYEHMDPKDLEDLMAKAIFMANLHGRATIADATAANA